MKNCVSAITNCSVSVKTYAILHILIATLMVLQAGKLQESNNPGPRWGHAFIYDPFHRHGLS